MSKISKTQIDQLGNRLRNTSLNEADLSILDDYRKSFGIAYEEVVRVIRKKVKLEPTGRPAKSTTAIIEKLRRESVRLSQVQDIAGCRVVVSNIRKQNDAVKKFKKFFPSASIIDRRIDPSYGYRAVHIVIKNDGKIIEVQIRTELQHDWADLSEKLSDKFDPSIKYGGGNEEIQKLLYDLSSLISKYEEEEINMDPEEMTRLKKSIAFLIAANRNLFLHRRRNI